MTPSTDSAPIHSLQFHNGRRTVKYAAGNLCDHHELITPKQHQHPLPHRRPRPQPSPRQCRWATKWGLMARSRRYALRSHMQNLMMERKGRGSRTAWESSRLWFKCAPMLTLMCDSRAASAPMKRPPATSACSSPTPKTPRKTASTSSSSTRTAWPSTDSRCEASVSRDQ